MKGARVIFRPSGEFSPMLKVQLSISLLIDSTSIGRFVSCGHHAVLPGLLSLKDGIAIIPMIYQHEHAPPAGPKFAEGMKYTNRFVMPIVDNIIKLEELRILPDLTELYRFYLYSWSDDLCNNGHSVVLRAGTSPYFVLQVACNHAYDGTPRLYLSIDLFHGQVEDLKFRGRIWDSGLGLVYSALNLIDRLSFYFKFENNAKRFCEKFLTLLGIGYYRCMHDFERVLLMSYGLSAAELFLDLFFRTPRTHRSKMNVSMMTEVKTLERAYF